ncbi:Listeria/Bacterioides repeat-containing protein [Pseudobutyrivibrio sp. OR37]|uniref:leucine-rich repeat protein n=1 Tax=Pseudobutyrivibrio sp. OR37 TaxID=1798186 RepID=UPI0008E26CC0|nr:leucine-rich repeat protein [Pseudobutyrivibrio sp. OR37]SFH98873.1 Listeria/Bacterioides repeat-containing protein [Pseudobutyrivibrio sp. OR37]
MKKLALKFLAMTMACTVTISTVSLDALAAEAEQPVETEITESAQADASQDSITSEVPEQTEAASTENLTTDNTEDTSSEDASINDPSIEEEKLLIEEADEEQDVDKATEENTFEVDSNGVLTAFTAADNFDGAVVIPDGVETIKADVFAGNTSITSVVFPKSLTAIPAGAFKGCSNLSTVEFKTTSTLNIEWDKEKPAFAGCAISKLILAEGLQTIPDYTFRATGFAAGTTITIPASVTKIGISAFEATAISGINFAENSKLKSIGRDAFYGCTSLASITFPKSLTLVGPCSFVGCSNLTAVTFEDGSALATIGDSAFESCAKLTSIAIPENTLTIGSKAFYGCSALSNLAINSGRISTVGTKIFTGTNLTAVTLSDAMTYIPENLFDHASFAAGTTLTIPESVTVIRACAFNSSNIANIAFQGNGLRKIETKVFEDCTSLEEITLPESLETIGQVSFKGCTKLKNIVIPNQVTLIDKYAFQNCTGLTNVTFGSKLSKIGYGAFMSCAGLTELNIPDNVTTIDEYAFLSCTGLKKISVSANVTILPYRAFGKCTNLEEAYLGPNVTRVIVGTAFAFDETNNSLLKIYAGNKSSKTYAALMKAVDADFLSKDQIIITNTIKYQMNGGTSTASYPTSYVEDADSLSTIRLYHPTKSDYVFAGWYLDAKFTSPVSVDDVNNRYTDIMLSSLSGNVTLYAKWIGPTFYTVTLDAVDGTVGGSKTAQISVAKDATYGECNNIWQFGMPEATKSGSRFIGWYTEDGELISDSTKVTNLADNQKLTARYADKRTNVAAPEIYAVGYGNIADSITVEEGTKLYFICDTTDATINYEITKDTEAYKSGKYSSNIILSKAGTYTVKATATIDGTVSQQATATITVESQAPALYTSAKAGKLWMTYADADYDAKNVKVPYTGAAVKLKGYKVYYGKTLLVEGTDYTVSYKNNTKAAKYDAKNAKGVSIAPTITINGKGSINGSLAKTFTIESQKTGATKATSGNTVITITSPSDYMIFDGTEKKPAITVEVKKTTVAPSQYDVTYTATKLGKGTITVTFNSDSEYYGSVSKSFNIAKRNINDTAMDIKQANSVVYSKTSLNGLTSIQLKTGQTTYTLAEKTDYTTKVSTKKVDGQLTATMTITGKGSFTGSRKITYNVTPADINNAEVKGLLAPVASTKKGVYKAAAFKVYDGSGLLKQGTDYTVSYMIIDAAGQEIAPDAKTVYPEGTKVQLTITGKGNYEKSKKVTYTVAKSYGFDADMLNVSISNVTYANKANICKPKLVIKNAYNGATLKNNKKGDYYVESYTYAEQTVIARIENKKTVYYVVDANTPVDKTDIVSAGTVINANIKGVGKYEGASMAASFRYIYDMKKATIKVANQTYTGKAIVPDKSNITVKIGNVSLSSKDFEIVSCENNLRAGTAKITIRGTGAYAGEKKVSFKIVKKSL